MPCALTLVGRGIGCKDSLGGIKRIYIAPWDPDSWQWGAVAATTAGVVDGVTLASGVTGPIDFYTYDMSRDSGSLNQTITADLTVGTVFFEQVCTVTFNKAAAGDIAEIANLVKGRVAILVQDKNDNWFVMGHKNGVEVQGGTAQTGTAPGDQNGFTLEFSAQETAPAPFLAVTANVPDDTDIDINAAPTPST
jgi:hypothetical protein